MSNKPDLNAINAYAVNFAEKVCEHFYKDQEHINGKQILLLTEVEQINLFVIKHIFEAWQKEAIRVQSPYFDYSSSEVREALELLMNTLSRNISISRVHLQPLLKDAVHDTLLLLFAPELYFEEFLGSQSMQIPVQKYLKPMFRYIRLHEPIANLIMEGIEGSSNSSIKRLDAVMIATEVLKANQEYIEKPDTIMAALNKILPVSMDDFYTSTEEVKSNDTKAPEVKETEFTTDVSTDDHAFSKEDKSSKEEEETIFSEPNYETPEYKEIEVKADFLAAQEEEKEKESQNINERFKEDEDKPKVSLLDKLKEEHSNKSEDKTLLDTLKESNKASKSLKSKIPLNKRFIFQKELFGNNANDFESAIEMVDGAADYTTALELLKRHFAIRFKWDHQSTVTMEFFSLVDECF